MNKAGVAVVLLNWQGKADTLACLQAIRRCGSPVKVVVVDNGSTDGSPAAIREWIEQAGVGHDYSLLALGENRGFAGGNNAGIRYALDRYDPEYLLVLNNDTLPAPGFLGPLTAVLANDPAAGLSAPRTLDLPGERFWQKPIPRRFNFWTYLFFATRLYRWSSRLIRLDRRRPSLVYAVPGSCFCFRRSTLEKIGLFDERTFLGSEEYIIAEKMRQAGAQSYFVPDSLIYHRVGCSTARLVPLEKIRAFLDSERYCLISYYRYGFWRRAAIRAVALAFYAGKMFGRGEFSAWQKIVREVAI